MTRNAKYKLERRGSDGEPVKITLATISGPFEVEAEVTGEWAAHRNPFDVVRPRAHQRWTVTHVPTGLRIPHSLTGKRARDLVERLAREVPTMGLPPRIASRKPKLAELGPAYRRRAQVVVDILAEVAR